MNSEKTQHPAQGVIIITKRHGNGQTIFGSDNLHTETVGIEIKSASVTRDSSSNRIYGEDNLLQLRMSAAQWAEMISSFGKGSGTPVTLTYRADLENPQVEAYKIPKSDHDQHIKEMRETINDGMQALRDLRKKVLEALKKPTVTKADLKGMIEEIDKADRELLANTKFVADSFEESLQERMSAARIEIEAFASNRVVEWGLDAMKISSGPPNISPNALEMKD